MFRQNWRNRYIVMHLGPKKVQKQYDSLNHKLIQRALKEVCCADSDNLYIQAMSATLNSDEKNLKELDEGLLERIQCFLTWVEEKEFPVLPKLVDAEDGSHFSVAAKYKDENVHTYHLAQLFKLFTNEGSQLGDSQFAHINAVFQELIQSVLLPLMERDDDDARPRASSAPPL